MTYYEDGNFVTRHDYISSKTKTDGYYSSDAFVGTTGFSTSVDRSSDDTGVLAQLRPIDRVKYLAKNNIGELIIYIVAFFGGFYMIIRAAEQLKINFFQYALAQSAQSSVLQSARDPFDWYVGGLMGVSLLCSLGMIMFCQNETKVSFGKDTTKMIIGFVVGFLSGSKASR